MGAAIDRALATGDLQQLLLWIAVLAVVSLMLSLAFRFMAQVTERAAQITQHRLRATLSRAVLHANGTGAKAPDGRVVSSMTNDVMRTAAIALTVYPVAEFAGIVFIAVSLLLIHWPLRLAVLVGAPLTVWIMGRLSGRLARASRKYQKLLADRAGVIIAHRLSQAAGCGFIIVMEHGRIIESGTHQELLTAGATYAGLWRAWSRWDRS